MFGQHTNTESPVDATGSSPKADLLSPKELDHREDGAPVLAVNTVVGLAATDPFTAILAQMMGQAIPLAKGEIVGIDDAAEGLYEVSSACPEHGSHLYKAQFTGDSIENPETGEPAPVLYIVSAADEDGGEAAGNNID